MTLKELIDGVDALIPNAYTEAQKTGWVNALAGRIQTEVWLRDAWDAVSYAWATDQNTALLPLPSAYTPLWESWLRAQIDLCNGEIDRYQNSITAYNDLAGAYIRWFAKNYQPVERLGKLALLGELTAENGESGAEVLLCTLPAGTLVLKLVAAVAEAFDSGTSDTLTVRIGSETVMTGGNIHTLGTVMETPTLVSSGGVYATWTGTGTTATTGRVRVYGRIVASNE